MRFKNLMAPLANKYYVVRHAQTDANKNLVYAGRLNSQLTEDGIQETKKILLSFEPDFIFSSPLDRAYDTAKIILGNERQIELDERLIEKDGGLIQNLTYTEIAEKYPDVWNIWETHSLDEIQRVRFPEGESDSDVVKRVENFLEEKEKLYKNKNILLVSHAGVLLAMRYLFGYPKEEIYLKPTKNSFIESFLSSN